MKRKILSIIGSIVLLTSFYLSSCASTSSLIKEFSLSSNHVLLTKDNPEQEVKITDSFGGEISIGIDNPAIADVSLDKDVITISALSFGTTTVIVSSKNNKDLQRAILVEVSDDFGGINKLEVSNLDSVNFYQGAPLNLSSKLDISVTDETGELKTLDKGSYYFSLADDTVFTTVGKQQVTVYPVDSSFYSSTFTIDILEWDIAPLAEALTPLKEGNYTYSFDGKVGSISHISGTRQFSNDFYTDSYLGVNYAKDNNGVFLLDISYGSNGVPVMSATHGYFSFFGQRLPDLESVISLTTGIEGLSSFSTDWLVGATYSNGEYISTNSDLLDLFWNNALGLNGAGEQISFSIVDGGVSYSIQGKLTNGNVLDFAGSISSIGNTHNENIEYYLSQNYSVAEEANSNVTDMKNSLSSLNYTLNFDDHVSYVTPDYVLNTYNDDHSKDGGVIKQGNSFYNFTYADNKFVLGDVASIGSIKGSTYDISSYSFFNDNVLYRYYPSSYFGLYTMFDTDGIGDLTRIFPDQRNNTIYVFGLNYGTADQTSIVLEAYFVNSDNRLEDKVLNITDIGSTKINDLEGKVQS